MKRSKPEDVNVPITPMLDMAFQLLTFFVLTYRPAPSEGQFSMNLLPAAPVASADTAPADPNAAPNPDVPAPARTLTTQIKATAGGGIGRVLVGEIEVVGMKELEARLRTILADKDSPFDQALIQADPLLRYDELMKVIDVYSSLNITKISFSELDPNAVGGAP